MFRMSGPHPFPPFPHTYMHNHAFNPMMGMNVKPTVKLYTEIVVSLHFLPGGQKFNHNILHPKDAATPSSFKTFPDS